MNREFSLSIALLVLCFALGAVNADFWGLGNILNIVRHSAMLGIFAIGLAFVITTGGIDLSVGSVIGLSGVIVAAFLGAGAPAWAAVGAAMATSIFIGFCQGVLITRLELQPFIVTLGGMLFVRGVSKVICNGGTISLGASPFRELADGGLIPLGSSHALPYPVLIFLCVALVGAYMLHHTVFGRYTFAIGGNRDAALYSGVPVKAVELAAYAISAALAGLAGVVYAAYIGQMSHTVGMSYELIGIAAVVLGGCALRGGEGTILGVVIGAAFMKSVENAINMFKITYQDNAGALQEWRLQTNWQYVIIGAVILIAVIADRSSNHCANVRLISSRPKASLRQGPRKRSRAACCGTSTNGCSTFKP